MSQKLFYLLLGICWLGSAATVRAQADFRAGYIVPLSGDTVRGFADYRGSARSAELCRFRPSADAEITSYGPAQLRGYGFGGGRQYRSQLLAAIDSVSYQRVPPPQPIFMELLVTGPLTLCYIRGKSGGDRFFVAPADSRSLTELLPRRVTDTESFTHAYVKTIPYRGVLTERMIDCPLVRMEVASVPFTVSALIGIVQRYNACRAPQDPAATATPTATARPVRRASERIRFGLVVGAEISQLSVTGASFLTEGHFVSSPRPVVGLGVSIPFASLSEKLSLRIEALVEQQRYADTFIGGVIFGPSAYEQVHLNLTYLRVPIQVRYTYPVGRLRPYVQAGLCYAHRLSFDTSVQQGRANSAGTIQYEPAQPLETYAAVINYEIGAVGSLGVQLPAIAGRALALEVRAENSSGVIYSSGVKSTNMRYFALVGYNFTK